MKAHHKAWQRIPALVVLALLVVRWERVPYSEAHAPTISPARSRASITVDASSKLKSYSAAPPFTAPYMPDYTSASAEFAPTAERHGADLDTIVPAQSAYQTAHPADAPCGSPQSDCGEGANNGGVPEYNWTGEIDPEINLLTHATRAPSKYVFLILKTPSFLQSSPGNNISYPTNLTAWSNIAADMWHHLYLKAPAWVSKTYIEIWNEPDGKGISLAQYESLYAAAAKAIKQAAAAFNSTAIVGGYVGAQFNTTWLQGWLSNTADNPYIDFVSWHEYANQHVSGSSDPQTMWTNLVSQYPSYLHNAISTAQSDIATYDSALQQNGGSHPNTIPILITEYNEDANGSPSLEGSPTYEIPYLGLFKQLAFTGGVDGINFFYPGGPDFGCQFVSWGMYLTDCSNQIAPWAWVEYLYLHSVGLQYQGFSVVKSSSSDATQFPLAFKLSDGSLGLVLTNSSTTNSVSESITLSNTGMSGSSTIHDYLVDPAHHLAQQPDLTGSAGSTGSISFSVTVPPSSVSGFTLASGAGTPVHVPTYQFQPFSDTFTSYGGAGATVAPPGRDHYTDDFPTWVSTGQVNPFTAINGTVATPASDGLTFADAGAGSSTTALKVSGPGQAYVRTGSYRVDWTRPPGNQKVAVTFQTDWSNMNPSGQGAISSQLILDRDKGNPTGKPLGSSSYLLLQDATGLLSLKTQAGTLGSYAYVPTAKTLSSWRMVIDASKVEVDRYIGGSWQAVIGPVAHNLPQTITGMEAGLLYLGLSGPSGAAGTTYWANVSVSQLGAGPNTPPTATPTSTTGSTNTPTPTATATSSSSSGNTTIAADSYNRTVSSDWGSADTGGPWTIVDTTANWSVSPGAGSITVAANGQERAYLGSVSAQDVEVLTKVVLPRSSQSNVCLAYVLGRYAGGSTPTYYRVGVGQGAGSSTVIIRAQRDDNTNLVSDVNTNIPAADGAVLWLRVQFQGVNPTTIRARAWQDGTSEPSTWAVNTTDSNSAEQIRGQVGIRGRNEDTSASHTFEVESYQATAVGASSSTSSTSTPTPTATPTDTPTPSPTATPTATATATNSVPGAPQSLAAGPAGGKNGKGVVLTWQAPASDGGSAITGYDIYRGTSSGAESYLTTVGNVLSYSDKAATSGTTYYYHVTAINAMGEGPPSNEAKAKAK